MERFGQCGRSSAWHQSSVWTPHVKRRRWWIHAPLLAGILSEQSLPGSAFAGWDLLAQRRRHMYRCAVHPVTFGYVHTLNSMGYGNECDVPLLDTVRGTLKKGIVQPVATRLLSHEGSGKIRAERLRQGC